MVGGSPFISTVYMLTHQWITFGFCPAQAVMHTAAENRDTQRFVWRHVFRSLPFRGRLLLWIGSKAWWAQESGGHSWIPGEKS